MGGYCVAQTSLAHTYGNVTCFITEYIKTLFPRDYFNTVHIASTIAYKQFDIFKNSKKEFIKKRKPMLIIRPRIEINDSDTFLYNTYLTTRMTDNYMDHDMGNLLPFLYDSETGNQMRFLMNRLKMYFDVTIVVETQMEQLNQVHFFKNRVRQDMPFFIRTSLESYIPRDLMKMIADDNNIPMYDEDGNVGPFLEYLNGISDYPISYKMKNASGNDEFFRFYPANIDTMFTGLSIDDGSKKGMIADAHTINFTVSAEFNSAGLYYYFSKKNDFIDHEIYSLEDRKSGQIIPYFTVSNLYTGKLDDGWNLYSAPIFMVDPHKVPDELNLKDVLNNSMVSAIEYHKLNHMPLGMFMKVILMKNNHRLVEEVDFKVDFKDYILYTYDCDPDATYRLIIHVNTLYVNDLVDDILKLSEEK